MQSERKGEVMTVKEFNEWCKKHGFEDAEMRMVDQLIRTRDFPITEWNLDAALRKEKDKEKHKVVIIG